MAAAIPSYLALALLLALPGCATRAWMTARAQNSLYGFESFLQQHPTSHYAVDAWARLDTLLLESAVVRDDFSVYERFFGRYAVSQLGDHRQMESLYARRARDLDCLFACEAFLRQFPDGAPAEAVRRDTSRLHLHLRRLADAARAGLPGQTHFRVSRELGPNAVPEYAVTAALVPNRDLDDGNPAHYFGSPAMLARALHSRCLQVACAAGRAAALPAGASLTIRIRHGIGVESMGFVSSHGRPMTIFAVTVPPSFLSQIDETACGDPSTVAQWETRVDLTPQITSGRTAPARR